MFLNLIVSSCEEFLCACRENTFYREGTHSIVKRSCVCVCVSVCIYAGKGGTEAVLVFFDKKLSSCPKNVAGMGGTEAVWFFFVASYRMQRESDVRESVCEAGVLVHGGRRCRACHLCVSAQCV